MGVGMAPDLVAHLEELVVEGKETVQLVEFALSGLALSPTFMK